MNLVGWVAVGTAGLGVLAGMYFLMSRRDLIGVKIAKERHDVKTANRDLLVKTAGGLVLIVTIVQTIQSLEISRETLESSNQGQITERYARAVDQLGSDNEYVRVGGIYALERFMNDSTGDRRTRDRNTVIHVLNAFVAQQGRKSTPAQFVDPLVLQRQGVMFESLSLVVALTGAGLVESAPV